MIRVFLAAFLFVVLSTRGAEKPTLAIVNGMSSPEAADLLLSKLSADGEFAFVERARLAEVVKEQQLSSLSRERNVRSGQLLGADALLFVEADRELLHVRLVETSRGERLFDEVFRLEPLDVTPVATAVRSRLTALSAGLRTPPGNRLYVALGPVASFRSTAAFRESLATLGTLIGVRLAQQERVLVVERENLAAVGGEQALTGKSAADLVPADAIVRARLADGDADQLSLEFQIQRPNGAAPAVFSTTVVRRRLSDAADSISAWIGRELGVRDQAVAAGSTQAEASRQHRNGAALLQARSFEPGLRYLETACLLDPANDDYAQTYLSGVLTCLQRGGQLDRGPAAERTAARQKEDYLFYLDRLRSAMAVAELHPATQSVTLFKGEHGEHPFILLGAELRLDEEGRAQLAACRRELRAFLERYATTGDWDPLGSWCPYFQTDPREALAYMRGLEKAGHFPWRLVQTHMYGRLAHWDQALAKQLWEAYLDEVQQLPAVDAQFAARVARCFTRNCFEHEFFTRTYPAPPAVQAERAQASDQLMAWLAEREENVDFAADKKNAGLFSSMWKALDPLPLADQDRYFERPMMRFLQRAQWLDSYSYAFTYLSKRCVRSLEKGEAPEDGPRIRKDVDRALAALAASSPNLHRDALGRVRNDPALAKLLAPDQPAQAGPSLPGGVLLFDSPGEENPVRARPGSSESDLLWQARMRGSYEGLVEGDILWLARLREKAVVVTRVVISRHTSETYVIPAPATGVAGRLKLSLSLSPTHLVIADCYRVYAIPRAKQAPYLDVAGCQVAGPKFGKDDTGGSTQVTGIGYQTGTHFRCVTAAFPAGDSVWLGLEERTVEGNCLYGALYRWRLGAAESELVSASDSLQPGPLNDCLPYRLLGGCATPAGDVCFVLDTVPNQAAEGRRRGLWKYTPGPAKWEQISELAITPHEDPPRFRTPQEFDIPTWSTHWQFDLANGTVRLAKGAVGGADPERGWYHYPESAGGVSSEVVMRRDGAGQSRRFAVPRRDGELASLLPTEQGLIVLIDGRELTDGKPTQRRMAWLLPEEK
ncbi:MAG TPA: CsgG/HfaB family protein [Chthoniobacteraceae bacterium]|jgi:hypothetical protein|nr:CsgG/HfaB family protein [Chthoniobacteraceae bacterium]